MKVSTGLDFEMRTQQLETCQELVRIATFGLPEGTTVKAYPSEYRRKPCVYFNVYPVGGAPSFLSRVCATHGETGYIIPADAANEALSRMRRRVMESIEAHTKAIQKEAMERETREKTREYLAREGVEWDDLTRMMSFSDRSYLLNIYVRPDGTVSAELKAASPAVFVKIVNLLKESNP